MSEEDPPNVGPLAEIRSTRTWSALRTDHARKTPTPGSTTAFTAQFTVKASIAGAPARSWLTAVAGGHSRNGGTHGISRVKQPDARMSSARLFCWAAQAS